MFLQTGQLSAVPAWPLQRKPGAPRPGHHHQSLPVERLPRCQGDATRPRTTTAARIGRYRCDRSEIEEGPQYFVSDLKVEGIEQLDKERSSRRGSAPCRASRSANSTSRWIATPSWRSISKTAFHVPPSSGVPSPGRGAQPHRPAFVIREGRQQFVREVLITGQPRPPARSSSTATSR